MFKLAGCSLRPSFVSRISSFASKDFLVSRDTLHDGRFTVFVLTGFFSILLQALGYDLLPETPHILPA